MVGVIAVRVAACILTAAAFLGGEALRSGVPDPVESVELERLPYQVEDWHGRDVEVSEQVLEILQPDGFLLREYVSESDLPILLYIDYHRVQRMGATIHSPRICYPGAGWKPTNVEVTRLDGGETARPVCWLRLRSQDREILAGYWYESRWGRSARETDLKLGIVRSAFARKPSDAALFRFATPLDDQDVEGARERIRRFVDAFEPDLERQLPFSAGS